MPDLPGPDRGRPLLAGAIWMIALLIIFVLGGYQSIASLNAKIALQLIAILTIGVWAIAAIVRPVMRPAGPLMLPIAGLCCAYVLSAIFSQRPRLSFEPALAGLAFACAFFALRAVLRDPWIRRRIAVLIVALTVAVSIMYIAQVVAEWVQWWDAIGRLAFPPLRPSWVSLSFGSPNLMASFLVLAGPLAVALLPALRAPRAAVWIVAMLMLIALVLTGTRAVYLGLVVGSVVGVALIILFSGASAVLQISRRTILIASALVGTTALVALPAVLYRVGQGGDTIRFDLWRSAIAIFNQFPILGGGPGTWVQLKTLANPTGVPNPVFSNAHSLYFQTGAELGAVGIVASLALAAAVLRLLAAGTRSPGGLSRESVGAGVGLTAFAVEAAFDTLTNVPMVCLLIVSIVAWIDAGLNSTNEAQRADFAPAVGRVIPAFALIVIVVSVPLLVRTNQGWASANEGDAAAARGDWPAAAQHYAAARATDPDFTLYDLEEASAIARIGRIDDARTRLQQAVLADPVAINLLSLAAVERDLGDTTEALVHVQQAIALGKGEPTVAFNAGLIAESLDELPLALDRYGEVVALAPELIQSSFWTSPDRKVEKDDIVSAAVGRTIPLNASLIYAYDAQSARARAMIVAQPLTPERNTYLAIVDWLSGDRDAGLAGLRARLEADPLDWLAAAWAARLLRDEGAAEEAVSYARWAYVVRPDIALGVIFEKRIDSAGGTPYAGLDRSYPTGVYLRPPTPFLLLPQLVAISAP
jgi:O-antigen ligase/tetratricopeptide (TPR) repeat protein